MPGSNRRYRSIGICITLLAFGFIAARDASGQGATATILGTVSDMSGAAIAGAAVQIKNTGTGQTQSEMTDAQGRFRVPDLGVGDYELQASKDGFSTVVHKGITLTVGAQSVVDFSLPIGQQQQTVTVEGQATQVDTTTATVGALVGEQQMRELPLNGRNFEQLILLAPGVQQISAFQSNSLSGRAPEYSIAGSRPTGQALLLDDENLQNFWNKGMGSITGSSLGVEAIGEFQTLTNTYSAQFGGNGGVVNAVSKSGSNAFHGSAFEFLRNSAMDARRFIDPGNGPPPFRRNQFGGSVGGPLKKDKAFFFVNYEGIRQALGETMIAFVPACNVPRVCTPTTTNPQAVQAIINTLALYPAPDPGTVNPATNIGTSTQVANQIAHENYVLARFDYALSSNDSVFVRYISDKADFVEPFAGGGFSGGPLPFWPETDNSHGQFATTEWRHIFSPTLINLARMSFSRPATIARTTGSTPPLQVFFPGAGRQDGAVAITGLSGMGGAFALPFNEIQNRYTEADDLTWTHGAHTVRFGAAVSRLQTNTYMPFRQGSNWSFPNLAAFLSGVPGTLFYVPLGPQLYANRDYRQIDFTPYVQDDWKISPKLSLNLGLRWEFMTNPVDRHNALYAIKSLATSTAFENVPNVMKSNPNWTNLAPRFGFAYDPFADHKTSIRGGFGMFYDLILPPKYTGAYWDQPPWAIYLVGSQVGQPNVLYPNVPSAAAGGLPTSSPGFDWNNDKVPYVMQYNFNVQRQIAEGTSITLGYVGSRGVHLFSEVEQNPPRLINGVTATCCAGGRIVPNPRVNPALGSFPDFIPSSSSNYNALQASLNRRFTKNVQAQIAYTYSKCMDDGSDYASFNSNAPALWSNPFNQHVDRGPCSYDITHVLSINALYALPFHGNRLVEGWQISGIVRSSTGLPLTILSGADQIGFGQANAARPNLNPGCSPNPIIGTTARWFDVSCFSLQAPGTFGNLGRDTVRGPHLQNTDIALLKDTRVLEQLRIQFRAEFFNIFNHSNYALPGNSLFIAGTNGAGTINPQAGRIINIVGTPRQLQFGLKLLF